MDDAAKTVRNPTKLQMTAKEKSKQLRTIDMEPSNTQGSDSNLCLSAPGPVYSLSKPFVQNLPNTYTHTILQKT